MTIHLAIGDASDVTRILGDNSIEGILTDPTYGQNLLGHSWDKVVPPVKVWKEFFRVLKPGGLRMAFGGSRTHHRLMVNLEDAGYLVRECLMWIYAKGYPSSLNLEKAIRKHLDHYPDSRVNHHLWEGYGTKLISAWEIIVYAKTLANNYVNNTGLGRRRSESRRMYASCADKAMFPVGDYASCGRYGVVPTETEIAILANGFPQTCWSHTIQTAKNTIVIPIAPSV